jgi:hypothetical protein
LYAQGYAGHPIWQGGGPKKNNKKMEGQGGGEAQGVADPKNRPKGRKFAPSGHPDGMHTYTHKTEMVSLLAVVSSVLPLSFRFVGNVTQGNRNKRWIAEEE